MTTAELATTFLRAWQDWETHPSDPTRTDRRVEAMWAFAESIGMNPVHAGDILASWRRSGLDHEQSIRALIAGKKAIS